MSSWLSFLRPRNRFSLAELRYLTEQLQKVQYVNDDNKDSVIEVLRSIAELVTYGDQHDPSIFEFFMEKQIMGEFARILKISKLVNVALQLLQTISIMIQNLKNEHSIYYIFSNEHINYLITYSFDFQNEELLSYYISFLRAISGKLNKNTISLLVKTKNEEVVSFPLYVEAIRFAFHDENMVRIAVRALTLNVYHVGDEAVNKYVVCSPQSDYFSNIVTHFSKRCINLDDMVAQMFRYVNSLFLSPTFDPSPKKLYLDCVTLYHLVQLANHLYALHKKLDASVSSSSILDAVDDIEDNLYYFSDVISAGVPDLGRLLTDNILQLLVFPLLLPSLKEQNSGTQVSIATSLHLLCSILHIFKTKDLATTIASALFCPPEAFVTRSEATSNGCPPEKPVSQESSDLFPFRSVSDVNIENSESSSFSTNKFSSHNENCYSHNTLRELLLSYIVGGNDSQVLGSLSLLTTLLQTKELDESVLDWLGILPQRRQHKKLLLEALVGEDAGEEQLFSSISMLRDNSGTELDRYLRKLKDEYGFYTKCEINPKIHRYQVLDALVSLFCRSNISAEILWLGGWLLRQLLPHGEEEFASFDLGRLKDSHKLCTCDIMEEIKGVWCDVLIPVLRDEWAMCKRALEASSPPKDSKSIFLPAQTFSSGGESSLAAAERMCEMVKVFVLQRQLLLFSFGGTLPDLPDIPDLHPLVDSSVISSPRTSVLDVLVPKPGSEISLANAVPCRIAFERGKERHFCFLAISRGISGWIILAQESPVRQQGGIVRVTAPLAGSDPKIDEKHPKWLHVRIRPSTLPFLDSSKLHFFSKGKTKNLVDGRWTLAFKDEDSCKAAESMLVKEINSQQREVERRLKTLLQSNTLETPEPCIVDTTDD